MEQSVIDRYSFLFGLIGYPLSHSFSKRYFNDKFEQEQLTDYYYELFPLQGIEELKKLVLNHANLKGLNVTIPYKKAVIPYLHAIDPEVEKIGAVNTIQIKNGKLKGFNTDVYGFEQSLLRVMQPEIHHRALILGTGGAAQAVAYVLQKNGIDYQYVSRTQSENNCLTYSELPGQLKSYQIIINTTPLGMSPNIESKPDLPYQEVGAFHLFYDLVYNPTETAFLKAGKERGATIKNGLEMLHLQAEKAWEIWNT